jgi:hypothetical protein
MELSRRRSRTPPSWTLSLSMTVQSLPMTMRTWTMSSSTAFRSRARKHSPAFLSRSKSFTRCDLTTMDNSGNMEIWVRG